MPITCKCINCNKEYKRKPYEKNITRYCSRDCQKEYNKAPEVSLVCKECSKTFSRLAWQIRGSHKGSYCSSECYNKSRSGLQQIKCQCGNLFMAYKSRIKYYDTLYCGRECYMKYGFHGRLTDSKINPNEYQKFLRQIRHTAKYLQWRKSVLEMQGNKCQVCGQALGLTVHHKIPVIEFVKAHGLNKDKIEEDIRFFDISLGSVLCRSHHLDEHKTKEISHE